jgi:hypothetical protein
VSGRAEPSALFLESGFLFVSLFNNDPVIDE